MPAAGAAEVVRHLLSGCDGCRRLAARGWRPQPVDAARLDSVLGRVADRMASERARVERERRRAGILLAELDAMPYPRRLLMLLNSERFSNWFVGEILLERAHAAVFSDPSQAVRLAEAGVALAGRISRQRPTDRLAVDLHARAWSILGNACRVSSDLERARDACARAEELIDHGSGDPLEEAGVLARHGLLDHAERRFDDAVGRFDAALRRCRMAGDLHLEGRVLTHKARSLGETGKLSAMIDLTQRALTLIDPEREPRLVLVAQHNLTWALKEAGRMDEALSLLQEILPLHARSGKTLDLLRLRWLEGKLAQAQGQLERAETAFREVYDGFVRSAVVFDAALVALDLAAVLYEQGRLPEMKQLAADVLPVFRSLGIHREALAALALFQKAVEQERISLRWLGALAGYLKHARDNPSLEFEPPA